MSEYIPGLSLFLSSGHSTRAWELVGSESRNDFAVQEKRILNVFIGEVNRIAEENMLKTGKLEGSHHAAMKLVMERYK